MVGIYIIVNQITNKKYVGKSKNIKKRFKLHKNMLLGGYHFNKHLQQAWNKYGADNFKFEIIEECLENELNDKEKYWILSYKTRSSDKGYNLTIGGDGLSNPTKEVRKKISDGNKLAKQNPVVKKRMSDAMIKRMSDPNERLKISIANKGNIPGNKGMKHTEESRRKMSAAVSGEKHPNYGKHLSKETKIKISEGNKGRVLTDRQRESLLKANLGRKFTEEHKKKISEGNKGKNKGIIRSPETRKKMSESKKGKGCGDKHHFYGCHHSEEAKKHLSDMQPKQKVKCNETGEIFNSINEASKVTGSGKGNISLCIKGKRKSANGYTFTAI